MQRERGAGLAARLMVVAGTLAGTIALGLRFGTRTDRLGVAVPGVAEDPTGRGSPGVPASPRSQRLGHEMQDMSGGLMVRLGLTLGTVVLLMVFAMIGFRVWMRTSSIDGQPAFTALQVAPQQPPSPTLQAHPTQDWNQVRATADGLLQNYAWADPALKRARIPIGRAMTLMAGQGMGPPP